MKVKNSFISEIRQVKAGCVTNALSFINLSYYRFLIIFIFLFLYIFLFFYCNKELEYKLIFSVVLFSINNDTFLIDS